MNKTISNSILASTLALTLNSIAQASLPTTPILNFTDGVNSCIIGGTFPTCVHGISSVATGSYFAMDLNANGFTVQDQLAISSAGTGLTLETAQGIGEIDLDWAFGGNNGRHQTLNALTTINTGINTYNVNMAGWTVNWGAEGNIDMGTGAPATLTCAVDCANGDTFTLEYEATVPTGAFTGVPYQLHLEGTVGQAGPPPPTQDISIVLNGGSNQECASTGGNTITANVDITTSDVNDIVSVNWLLNNVSVGSGNSIDTFASLGIHELSVEVTTVDSGTFIRSTPVTIADNTNPNLDILFINQKTGDEITQVSRQFKNTVKIIFNATDICDPELISTGYATQSDFVDNNSTIEIDKGKLITTAVNVSGYSSDSSNNSTHINATLLIVD